MTEDFEKGDFQKNDDLNLGLRNIVNDVRTDYSNNLNKIVSNILKQINFQNSITLAISEAKNQFYVPTTDLKIDYLNDSKLCGNEFALGEITWMNVFETIKLKIEEEDGFSCEINTDILYLCPNENCDNAVYNSYDLEARMEGYSVDDYPQNRCRVCYPTGRFMSQNEHLQLSISHKECKYCVHIHGMTISWK
jgi:hypothetical protein